jgi:hypothetical protein
MYTDHNAALAVQAAYPQTRLWASQRILPDDTWVLLPEMGNGRRLAFAPQGEQVVAKLAEDERGGDLKLSST